MVFSLLTPLPAGLRGRRGANSTLGFAADVDGAPRCGGKQLMAPVMGSGAVTVQSSEEPVVHRFEAPKTTLTHGS